MRSLLLFCAAMCATPAVAQAWGTPEACAYVKMNGAANFMPGQEASGVDGMYFDGKELLAMEWKCDVTTGQCEGEDSKWTQKFTLTSAASAVTLADTSGVSYTLSRCD